MYDARGGGSSSNNGTMFAAAVAGVAAIGFAAVFFWPSGNSVTPAPMAGPSSSTSINAVFPGNEEQKFANVLKQIDESAYADLERKFSRQRLNDGERHAILMTATQDVAIDHINTLAKSDVKHMDIIMDDIIGGLQQASRSNARLCQGKTFIGMDQMKPAQAAKFFEREFANNKPLQEFTIKLNRRFLEAIVDGRKNPKRYGKLDASDKRALDMIGPELMRDPKMLTIIMSAGAASNPEDVLASVDVCEVSVMVLRAVDRLPQKTKGRLWAATFAEIKKKGTFEMNPATLKQYGGF